MENYIFDKKKIEGLLSDFYVGTGIAVTLYDADMTIVSTSPVYSSYCARVRAKEAGRSGCDECDRVHMQMARENGRAVFYSCHAGLTETVTPIFYEGTLIAYIQTGQFRDADGCYSDPVVPHKTEHSLGYREGELSELYEKTPIISKEKLSAHLNIINALVKSFWVDGLISLKRSMLSVRIERYIEENLREVLTVDHLCLHFGVSKNALYGIFHREFGNTVTEYVNERRLTAAKKLLHMRNKMSISHIAESSGFSDYNYFIRVFRKHFGTTPLQYRKNI